MNLHPLLFNMNKLSKTFAEHCYNYFATKATRNHGIDEHHGKSQALTSAAGKAFAFQFSVSVSSSSAQTEPAEQHHSFGFC